RRSSDLGLTANGTSCKNGISNGTILINGDLTIGHSNATNPTFRIDFFTVDSHLPGTCTFTGSYTQEGKLGTVAGSWSCTIQSVSNPPHGTFTLSQIEANTNGITSRFLGSDQNCS